MLELIKKGYYLGLGVLTLTREKAESIADELIERGEATSSEKKRLVEKLLERAKEEETKLTEKMEEAFKKVVDKGDFATKEDIARLEKKLDAITSKLTSGSKTSA